MKLTAEKVKWLRSQIGTAYQLREAMWKRYGVVLSARYIREILSNRVWYDENYEPKNRILINAITGQID